MKLRLERAFKIVSKTDFGSKMIPQTAPKSLPKSVPKVIPLGSHLDRISSHCKTVLSLILYNFGSDLGLPWE